MLGVADAARRRWSPWTPCTFRQALHQDVGFPTSPQQFLSLTTTNRDPFLCLLQGTCLGDCLLSVCQDCAIARVQFRDEMRHPLRAVTSSVQSQHIKQTKKVTDSQQLRHLITAKFCYFTAHASAHFLSSTPTAQCLKHEEIFQPLVTGIVVLPLWLPQHVDGYRRGEEFLFFRSRPHIQLIRFFLRSMTSKVFCPRSLQAFGSPGITPVDASTFAISECNFCPAILDPVFQHTS